MGISVLTGVAFTYDTSITDYFWTFSRFLDLLLEVPQLRRVYFAEKLSRWIVVYYVAIGLHVFFHVNDFVYTFVTSTVCGFLEG